MDLGLISVRYARALLKAGIEAKEADKVYADMQSLAHCYSTTPALRITIDNPMLSKKQKESLLLTAAAGGSCDLTKRFCRPLCSKKTVRVSCNSSPTRLLLCTESITI